MARAGRGYAPERRRGRLRIVRPLPGGAVGRSVAPAHRRGRLRIVRPLPGGAVGRGVARVSAVRDGRAALAQPHAGGRIDPIGRAGAFATDGPRRVC